jgi:DNA (cytosine-5)-methyltransferase 1
MGRIDFESETFVAHALRGEGFDASEDGTGRGTPLVSVTYSIMPQNSGKDYKAREVDVAQPVMAGGPVGGNQGGDYIVHAIQAGALRENPGSGPDGVGVQADHAYTLEARAEVQAVAFALRGREGGAMPEVSDGAVSALRAASGGSSRDYVAFPINPNALRGDTRAKTPSKDAAGAMRLRDPGLGVGEAGDPADTLQAAGPGAVGYAAAVRRLTPRECERLQGFPDDYTLIPWRKGMAPDGPRYKALGNSMAVPVMRWIGERIAMVDAILAAKAAA